jgi:hypothetical protein
LTMLYRSTDCLSRRGAAMKKLSHSASFAPRDKGAPSNPGIKQLALRSMAEGTSAQPKFVIVRP